MPDENDEAGVVESLPSRPLTEDEVAGIGAGLPEGRTINIGSMMFLEGFGHGVVSLIYFQDDDEQITYLGFNPNLDGWTKFEQISADKYTQEGSNELITEWGREVFGDEDEGVTHSSHEI